MPTLIVPHIFVLFFKQMMFLSYHFIISYVCNGPMKTKIIEVLYNIKVGICNQFFFMGRFFLNKILSDVYRMWKYLLSWREKLGN